MCARWRDGSCSADPCRYQNDGVCDVPGIELKNCAFGDYVDCKDCLTCGRGRVMGDWNEMNGRSSKSAMLRVNGTLPDAIGSLACRSKITSMYAHPQLASSSLSMCFLRSLPARIGVNNFVRPLARAASVCDSCCRIFDQQPFLVGTVPLTISALTRLYCLYAPPPPDRLQPPLGARVFQLLRSAFCVRMGSWVSRCPRDCGCVVTR